jgi:hypothetical protein
MKKILIQVKQDGEDEGEQVQYAIGVVSPPAIMENWSDEKLEKQIDEEWTAWHKSEPYPDSDSQFIEWLTERGWKEEDMPLVHVIEG